MWSSNSLPLPTTISVHQSPSPRSQRSIDLSIESQSSNSKTSKSLLSSSGSEQESESNSHSCRAKKKKRSFVHHCIAMNHQLKSHEIPPPPKLRRLVASYWKQPGSDSAKTMSKPPAVPVTPNWELITQGPPASGSYEYNEHYYGTRSRKGMEFPVAFPSSLNIPHPHGFLRSDTSPVADTLPLDFGQNHCPKHAATTTIHKPKAKPFYKTEASYEPTNNTLNMDNYNPTNIPPHRYDTVDDDEMSTGTTLANDSFKLFETVKQAVVQFGGLTCEEDEEDDEELAEFLQYAIPTVHPGCGTGTTTTAPPGTTTAINATSIPTTDTIMFQAITPSPDPIIIHERTTERKLPPILPPLHHDENPSRTIRLLKKKYSSYPPPFFSTTSSSLGSIPREIIAPVVYPEVVVATQGDREDPMDPRFGIEHPPRASW